MTYWRNIQDVRSAIKKSQVWHPAALLSSNHSGQIVLIDVSWLHSSRSWYWLKGSGALQLQRKHVSLAFLMQAMYHRLSGTPT